MHIMYLSEYIVGCPRSWTNFIKRIETEYPEKINVIGFTFDILNEFLEPYDAKINFYENPFSIDTQVEFHTEEGRILFNLTFGT